MIEESTNKSYDGVPIVGGRYDMILRLFQKYFRLHFTIVLYCLQYFFASHILSCEHAYRHMHCLVDSCLGFQACACACDHNATCGLALQGLRQAYWTSHFGVVTFTSFVTVLSCVFGTVRRYFVVWLSRVLVACFVPVFGFC